jgi:hypothetical protein
MGWIKSLPCACSGTDVEPRCQPTWLGGSPDVCSGPVEAHHAGAHGLGQKADDDSCIPLCVSHHRQLTDRREVFANWYPGTLKLWELAVIVRYQQFWKAHLVSVAQNLF